MAAEAQFRCDVAGPEALRALRDAPLPGSLRGGPAGQSFHRDIYLDTPDRSLFRRGASCRVRVGADDRRILTVILGGTAAALERFEAAVPELDPRQALEAGSEPARRLRGLVDPALLRPRLELEVERWSRVAASGFFVRQPRFTFCYDSCTVRQGGLSRTFEELEVRRIAEGGPSLVDVAASLERSHGLRPLVLPRHERAAQLVESLSAEAAARRFRAETSVVLLAIDEGNVAFLPYEGGKALPVARGSGEEAARHLLGRVSGSRVGNLSLVGSLQATEERDALEVWVARRIRGDGDTAENLVWLPAAEAVARIGTPEIRAPETLAALAVAARSSLIGAPGREPTERFAPPMPPKAPPRSTSPTAHYAAAARASTDLPPEYFLNAELSQIAFNERVLEMAEDEGMPLAERLRFLAIVSANFDEFFSVRVGALKAVVLEGKPGRGFDGLSAREQLDAIGARVRRLSVRQAEAAERCFRAAEARGLKLRRWEDLDAASREALSRHFEHDLLPVLTPRAVTMSPGHPFPVIPQFTLTFGVVVQDLRTGPIHFTSLPIPQRLDRIVPVPGSSDFIFLEEVVRANIQAFYPDRTVDGAWLFRITRGGDLDVNEEEAGDLLQAIEEEVRRRPANPPVRVEMERGMPAPVRETIVRELRFERRGVTAALGSEDVYEVDSPMDFTVLRQLADQLPPDQSFAGYHPRRPLPGDRGLFDQIDRGDLLVHHPYDDFTATVGRFLEEAADDPEVVGIKLTLYRLGSRSPIVDALLKAAGRGKDVAVFVELKARFDEATNVGWVRRLEEAGAQVIYGLVGLKIHAKVALVIRKSADGLKRYAHIGTGNYNASTARFYTDLGLFTADADITADLTDLFNQLTGSSRAPGAAYRRLLVAPATMLSGFLERIERETAHALAGRGGKIRAQVNGVEDPEIIAALYRASTAGVDVDLLVRGLCMLRPGMPGVSDRIRVRSVLGRFLEHERVFQFGNGGQPEYLLGSADWRPRNLRRRVEVVTPVQDPGLAGRLDALLTALFDEPSAWTLESDGTYTRTARPAPDHPHLHDRMLP